MFASCQRLLHSPGPGESGGGAMELGALKAALLDSMSQLAWIVSAEGDILWCNKRYLDYTGLSLEDFLREGWLAVLDPKEIAGIGRRWQKETAGGDAFELECALRSATGGYRQFLIGAVPWRDATGKVVNWLGTCTDIHSQKETQQVLRVQQAELRVLFDLMPAYVWFKDTQNRILRVNKAAADATGRSVEEIEGKSTEELHPENAAQFYADDLEVIKSKAPKLAYIESMINPDGDQRWVQTDKVPYFDSEGQVIGLVVVARDVTEQKRASDLIKSQEARFRTVFEGSRDAIILVSESGIFDCNQRALELFGYESKEELMSINPATLSPAKQPDGRDSLTKGNEYIARAFKEGSVRFEWTHLHKNGQEWQTEVHLSAYLYDGKMVIQGTTHDITERNKAQAALREASRMAGMAEVATNVLHNVGNVLNSVNVSATLINECLMDSGAARLMKVVAVLEEHKNDMARFIQEHAQGKQLTAYLAQVAEHQLARQKTCIQELQSLQKNIEHIKTIVALQQNHAKASGPMEPLGLSALVEDSLRINAGVLTRQRVKVTRQFAQVGPVLADRHKMLQILVNLVRNAEQSCVESGREDKEITIAISGAEGRVRVTVSDNGVGIARENLNRVFNQGFTTKKDGHGFGLHSAALAAKEMHGTLEAGSPGVGMGATFVLELPMAGE